MYEKSILLLQDARFRQYVRVHLNNRKLGVEESPLLFDTEYIRRDILSRGNTSSIRAALVNFIRDSGFPRLLMLDYTVDFGLSPQEDPDHRKLLRTIAIAYIILANAKGFDSAIANLIFVINRKQENEVKSFIRDPSLLLKQFTTHDDRINTLINGFIKDRERLKTYFYFTYIYNPSETSYADEMKKLENCIDLIESRIAEHTKEIKQSRSSQPTTEMINSELNPADVFCRATGDKILVNGSVRAITEEEEYDFQEKYIVLQGALTSRTINTVKDRITATFNAMSKLNPFKKDDRIFICIPDSSLIDGAFASSIGTFLSNTLSSYSGISLDLGPENSKKLKNSTAYIAVKDFVLKNI